MIAQRPIDPAPQTAAAHRGCGFIQHSEQRVLQLPGRVKIQFQITAAGRIQQNAVVAALGADALDMGQGALLGVFNILQQTARRSYGGGHVFAAVAFQVKSVELL